MKRYLVVDEIRGFTLMSMIIYHGMWDLVYLFGADIPWYESEYGFWWQQSICCTFILLSGFCFSLGRNKLRHGITISIAGIIISLVTAVVMPENIIICGVLTMIGACSLIMVLLEKPFDKVPSVIGMLCSIILFVVCRNINDGYLGFKGILSIDLPVSWYRNVFTACLGFPYPGFYSSDYFSILPWIFLYITGYFVYRVLKERDKLTLLTRRYCRFAGYLGRHSLIIYMAHQVVIYGVLCMWTIII